VSDTASPFDTIESAQEFISLFEKAIAEALVDVRQDVADAELEVAERRLEALRLVAYKMDKLACHISQSRRLLNDLRMLRRVLYNEASNTVEAAPKGAYSPL
jgi:hypothetical protein